MRLPLLVVLACLASGCHPRPAAVASSPPPASGAVRFEYRPPTNPAHQAIYADLRDRRVLEQFAEGLSVLRLPRPLTLTFASCDGVSNAWYEPADATVTFCYEYVADIRRMAATKNLGNVPFQEACDGPVVYVLLHEAGHAVFDLLQVPILGREEDAADTFAAVVLLRMGKGIAMRTLRGTAWQYAQEAQSRTVDESDFADVHGLDAQRYYNLLCLAYGSDQAYFAAAIKNGHLPADRAEGCAEEYQVALYALRKLVMPSMDAGGVEQLRARHGKRWESPP